MCTNVCVGSAAVFGNAWYVAVMPNSRMRIDFWLESKSESGKLNFKCQSRVLVNFLLPGDLKGIILKSKTKVSKVSASAKNSSCQFLEVAATSHHITRGSYETSVKR